MREYAFDAIVFLHRSQPLHKAHKKIYDRALALGKLVIPIFGSDRKALNTYNPFTTKERIEMSKSCFDEEDLARLRFAAVCDHPYKNPVWLAEVHTKVREILDKEFPERVGWSDYDNGSEKPLKIGLIGYKKDDTSAYLDWFPQWEFIDTASFTKGVSATQIRHSFFMECMDLKTPLKRTTQEDWDKFLASKTLELAHEDAKCYDWHEYLPPTVAAFLENFREEQPVRMQMLMNEHKSNLFKKFLKEGYPYPIIENTVDSVPIKNGHVLLVRRGEEVGYDQWALPGGYIGEFEEKFVAALRELNEETNINFFRNAPLNKVDQYKKTREELIKCCVDDYEFGHPMRSTRGRVITRAYHFELPDGGDFPYVRGADDATDAKWFPIAELYNMRDMIFEDHLDIIEYFAWKPTKKWTR